MHVACIAQRELWHSPSTRRGALPLLAAPPHRSHYCELAKCYTVLYCSTGPWCTCIRCTPHMVSQLSTTCECSLQICTWIINERKCIVHMNSNCSAVFQKKHACMQCAQKLSVAFGQVKLCLLPSEYTCRSLLLKQWPKSCWIVHIFHLCSLLDSIVIVRTIHYPEACVSVPSDADRSVQQSLPI